ncbi:unnamed protein product [Miscanthus lutarioriparius]|uniref:Uncharacterized protein n=1 Tax=Miscanthus lutarioriparius TaxID=422564 RepID=A0A811SN67_9POAL|nr:unnamed protein product [Miscanthus lutarioriparius]
MGGEATNAGGGGFRARMEHYLYSGEKKHVLAGIAIFAAAFGVPWYFMTRGKANKKYFIDSTMDVRTSDGWSGSLIFTFLFRS